MTLYGIKDDDRMTTPRGAPVVMNARDDTSDLSVIGSTMAGVVGSGLVDEYHLADLHITGRFVDVGAHIGTITVAVLLDNPQATAICVEPIPENVEMLAANLAANGLTERATIMVGAVGSDHVYYQWEGNEHLVTNRFIANPSGTVFNQEWPSQRIEVREVKLRELLPCDAMKLDCEGGEWALFRQRGIGKVPYIFGEFHGNPGADGVTAALGKTHDVTFGVIDSMAGAFRAVARG